MGKLKRSEVQEEELAKLFRDALLRWAVENLRDFPWRHEKDPYKILVTEKLLQQTDYGHVRKAYDLFFEKFPTIFDLAKASEQEVEEVLRPLGFWRQRAKQFMDFAKAVVANHNGEIPATYEKLKSLSGIGDYVARATLCFAFGNPGPLLDVNTRKVVSRFFFYPEKIKDTDIINILEKVAPKDPETCKTFYWGVIDFSATVCARAPKCGKCSVKEHCTYYRYQSS